MCPAGKDALPPSVQVFSPSAVFRLVSFCCVGGPCIRALTCPFWTAAIMNIVLSQPCGKIFVGDPHQQIYTFRGAVNALFTVPHTHVFYLTQVRLFFASQPPHACTQTHTTHTQACVGLPTPVFQCCLCAGPCARFYLSSPHAANPRLLSRGSPWFSGVCRVRTVFKIVTCLLRLVDICTDDAEPVVSRGLSASPPL